MPRRDAYLTDDDDDNTPRRAAAAGGGGVPGWVWVAVAGGALAVLVVGGLLFARSNQREAVMRHEVQRADMMRAEVQARPPVMAEADHVPGGIAGPGGQPVLSLARITNSYKSDRAAAEDRYTGQQLRVRVEVTMTGVRATGERWVGASVDLGAGPPRGTEPNVIFRLTDGLVAAGTTVVLEVRCDGLLPDPRGGETLTFTDCRVVRE